MELWATIKEFWDYEISTHGRVRNSRTGRLIKLAQNRRGDQIVVLRRDGRQYSRGVLKLVAEHFVPNNGAMNAVPTHKNGDKSNNRVDNIVWRRPMYNRAYRQQYARTEPLVDRPMMCLQTKKVFPNSRAAADEYELLEINVCQSARDDSISASGRLGVYDFRYV